MKIDARKEIEPQINWRPCTWPALPKGSVANQETQVWVTDIRKEI